MSFTDEQFVFLQKLKRLKYFVSDSDVRDLLAMTKNDMFTPQFVNVVMESSDFVWKVIPQEMLTVKLMQSYFEQEKEEIDFDLAENGIQYFAHLLGNDDFIKLLIDNTEDALHQIPKCFLNKKHYDYVINREMKKEDPDSFQLCAIPKKHLSFEQTQYFMGHSSNAGIWTDSEKYFDKAMLPYFLEHCSPVLTVMPKFMYEGITDQNMIGLMNKDLAQTLKMPKHLWNDKLLTYSLSLIGEDNKGFSAIYNLFEKRKNKHFVKEMYDKGFYSTVLFDDLIEHGIEFNPVKMYQAAFKLGNTQYCISRIFKHFSQKKIREFYKQYELMLSHKEKVKAIKDLGINEKMPEEFLCPCCNKPLPQDLIDKIRGVQNND